MHQKKYLGAVKSFTSYMKQYNNLKQDDPLAEKLLGHIDKTILALSGVIALKEAMPDNDEEAKLKKTIEFKVMRNKLLAHTTGGGA